jgi:hypothetical protein
LAGDADAFVTKFDSDGKVEFSTYLGGKDTDFGKAIAVDGSGNVYVSGGTDSGGDKGAFPTTKGAFQVNLAGRRDAFVTKFEGDGKNLVYSTFLGGKDTDFAAAIAADSDGDAYVTGKTYSPDFKTSANPYQNKLVGQADAFVAKFGPTGDLVYSTYLGGEDTDRGNGIAVDADGNAYVVGSTLSSRFPTTKGVFQPKLAGNAEDAFVTKVNPQGTDLVYSTYFGGQTGDETGHGIAVDVDGNACVIGDTLSTDLPVKAAFQDKLAGRKDAFVAKFDPQGAALVYSSYLGGKGETGGEAIALDRAGDVYLTGFSSADNLQVKNAFQPNLAGKYDAFVAKITTLKGAALINVAVFQQCQGVPCQQATIGGGAPYSNLVGSFLSEDIQFGTKTGFDWHPFGQTTFGADMQGVINVASAGSYTFTVTSDDGSLLLIDGNLVVDNGGPHPPTVASNSTTLTPGVHAFEVQYFECCDGPAGINLDLPTGVTYGFTGSPGGGDDCYNQSVSALVGQFGTLDAAAAALGFPDVQTLQDTIQAFCQQ